MEAGGRGVCYSGCHIHHSTLQMTGALVQRHAPGKPGRARRGGARQGRSLPLDAVGGVVFGDVQLPFRKAVEAGVLVFDAGAALTYDELQESGWTGSYDKLPPDCIRCTNSE